MTPRIYHTSKKFKLMIFSLPAQKISPEAIKLASTSLMTTVYYKKIVGSLTHQFIAKITVLLPK